MYDQSLRSAEGKNEHGRLFTFASPGWFDTVESALNEVGIRPHEGPNPAGNVIVNFEILDHADHDALRDLHVFLDRRTAVLVYKPGRSLRSRVTIRAKHTDCRDSFAGMWHPLAEGVRTGMVQFEGPVLRFFEMLDKMSPLNAIVHGMIAVSTAGPSAMDEQRGRDEVPTLEQIVTHFEAQVSELRAGFRNTIGFLELLIRSRRMIGGQLSVSLGHQTVVDTGIGMLNVSAPATGNSLFPLRCLTKPLYSMALLGLVENGSVSLNQRVCEFFPSFSKNGKSGLTLFHLLTHSTNVVSDPLDVIFLMKDEDLWCKVCNEPAEPTQVPGRVGRYSTFWEWYVLAKVVERITARSVFDYVSDTVCKPLGLDGIALCVEAGTELNQKLRLCQRFDCRQELPTATSYLTNSIRDLTARLPGYSGYGSAREMNRFYGRFLRGGGGTILSELGTLAMTVRQRAAIVDSGALGKVDYGLGVMLESRQYGTQSKIFGTHCSLSSFGHRGGDLCFSFLDPAANLAITLLTNSCVDLKEQARRNIGLTDAIYADLKLT